jgi:6-phosphogluconate dehydrogenase
MQLGMIGLGRMGINMCRRLMRAGHQCVVHDVDAEAVARLAGEGAIGLSSLHFVARLERPRHVWMMLPAAIVEQTVAASAKLLEPGDVLFDGGAATTSDASGNSARPASNTWIWARAAASGAWNRAFCLMIGGEQVIVQRFDPIFGALAPGSAVRSAAAETTPLDDPRAYRYDLNLGDVAEVWRRGSVIRAWLLDLTAQALLRGADLLELKGHVADSVERRWTIKAAIDTAAPVPVLSAALFARISSRGEAGFADKLLSAMCGECGGHAKQTPHKG